nr:aminotransferase class I/II-fold pyridoxal phosphate-dependent enzyme [Halalkalibacter okhensis]
MDFRTSASYSKNSRFKTTTRFWSSNLSQLYATELLLSLRLEHHLTHLRDHLKNRRDIIVQSIIDQFNGEITFFEPNGGIHLWCKINDENIDHNMLFKKSINQGVIFAPGKTLGSKKEFLRFSFSRPQLKSIKKGIDRFSYVLKKKITNY